MSNQEILQLILDLLPFLIPIILIQMGLAAYALIDLSKRETVKGGKTLWIIILIIMAFSVPTGMIVTAAYFVWARHVEV